MTERRYPWTRLLDGTPRILREGDDFDCSVDVFENLARRAARVRHRKAVTRRLPLGYFVIMAIDTEAP